jgi:transposase
MAKFSENDRDLLNKNSAILKVTASNVTYTTEFKAKAVKLLQTGKSATDIFSEAGIDTTLFGDNYAQKSITRWENAIAEHGEKGLKTERRGVGATGRPKGVKFKSIEEENAYLRAENEFLKKLRALEEEEFLASQKDLRSSTRRSVKTHRS